MSFNEYINTLKQKPNGGNGILAKLRYYISTDTPKTIYYALFDSHMRFACQIWGQGHSKIFDDTKHSEQTLKNYEFQTVNGTGWTSISKTQNKSV